MKLKAAYFLTLDWFFDWKSDGNSRFFFHFSLQIQGFFKDPERTIVFMKTQYLPMVVFWAHSSYTKILNTYSIRSAHHSNTIKIVACCEWKIEQRKVRTDIGFVKKYFILLWNSAIEYKESEKFEERCIRLPIEGFFVDCRR